jgi:Ca2+:H+ antiporter
MAHVITQKIPIVIEQLGLSPNFVGLVFYTIIPNAAEYMNAIKFAVNGNIGLSMEIGNQGAILAALIEMPALVLLSYIQHKVSGAALFTLVFPVIDIFVVIISVLLRNSILMEKTINYFTGRSFLFIMVLICVVYFFENPDHF